MTQGSGTFRAVSEIPEIVEAFDSPERILTLRWLLTWKPVFPAEPPKSSEPTALTKDGLWKAKARIIILGFQHPDLVRYNSDGRAMLNTTSPTVSHVGKMLFLQTLHNQIKLKSLRKMQKPF